MTAQEFAKQVILEIATALDDDQTRPPNPNAFKDAIIWRKGMRTGLALAKDLVEDLSRELD